MERKLKLSKNAYLWEVGDNAHNIAILETGKIGVQANGRIVGIITPKMVLGETAISTLEGKAPKRTATCVALEDETNVTEYPAVLVKKTFDSGNDAVTQLILMTLVGQTCRNCLLLMATFRNATYLNLPMKGLMQGIVNGKEHIKSITTWEDFMVAFKFLSSLRDFSETLRQQHVVMTSDKGELIEKASASIREMLSDADLVPMLEGFIKAEEEKDVWLEKDAY